MTTGEIEYPIVEESLCRGDMRGDVYRARALALAAQCQRLRTIAEAASNNERDALRQMLITRGAMAIMEDCERQQIEQLREWIASRKGQTLDSRAMDTLRGIYGIEEAS